MTHDKLHEIIQTLTKSEKRYFKLYSKKTNPTGEKNYIKLFDILEVLKTYEENALIELLQQQSLNTNYLAADKNYLYKLILESLRSFHAAKSSYIKLRKYLDNVEILMDKGLGEQAYQQVKKAHKLAEQYNIFFYLPEILHLKRKLLGHPIRMKEIDHLYEDYQQALTIIQNFNEYDFLYRRSFLIRRKIGKARTIKELQEFDFIIEHPLMQENKGLSFSAQVRYFQIWATYYYSKDNWQKEYECNKQLVHLMSHKKEFIEEHPYDYASTFSRMLILTKRAAPQVYFETLEKFKTIPKQVSRDKRKVKSLVFSIVCSTESVRLIKEGKYQEAKVLLPEFELFLKNYSDLVDDAFKMNFYYKFAYICIGTEDYSKALDYINLLMNEFDEKHRPDIYSFAKILDLVIHLELQNFEIIPYLAKSTINYLKKRQRYHLTEELLFAFFKKIKPPMSRLIQLELMKELQQSLKTAFQNPKHKKSLAYFDFMTWLDSRINGISFITAKKRNLKKEKEALPVK